MIKLNDFARAQGVTDRQVQRLIKKYEKDLQEQFERRGQDGTWLSAEACDFLRGKMRSAPVQVYDDAKDKKIEELEAELRETKTLMHQKEMMITKAQETVDQKSNQLEDLRKEMRLIEDRQKEQIDAAVKAAEDALHQKLTSEHQKKLDDIAAAHEQELTAERERKLTLADLSRFFKRGSGR